MLKALLCDVSHWPESSVVAAALAACPPQYCLIIPTPTPPQCIPSVKGVFSLSGLKRPKQMMVRGWHQGGGPHMSKNPCLAFSGAVSHSPWYLAACLTWCLATIAQDRHAVSLQNEVRVRHQMAFCSTSYVVLDLPLTSSFSMFTF